MEKVQEPTVMCRNVFKDGNSTPSKVQLTKLWTEMIIKVEKGKVVNISKK